MSPQPHDLSLPHNISGTGLVTECPPECRAHCRWLDQRAMRYTPPERPSLDAGYEPLGDETWGGEELGTRKVGPTVQVSKEYLRDFTPQAVNDLFGVMPNAPEPQPITALFGDGDDVSPRESALREATSLVTGDRNAQYGPPTQDFQRTADLLTALGYRFADFNTRDGVPYFRDLTASDVAIIMIQLKMSRIIQSRNKRDSWVDLAGYAGCGYECTTEEYN